MQLVHHQLRNIETVHQPP